MLPRNNDKIFKWAKILGVIAAALVTIAVAYGSLNQKVEHLETQQKKNTGKIEEHGKAVVGVQKDVEYIRKTVDRIESKLNNEQQ